ncbi:hypothetical protein [Comamonas sp. GB3 AK4-5]|uniref:hypothetical protein n=1 Tax=Comamonas sp. GB3 AK4-5 TaxID=3231487 RepID=UPI00351F21BB
MGLRDYLHIVSDKSWAGENFIDWRARWYTLDEIEQIGVFDMPGVAGKVRGEWVAEGGDQSVAPEKREPRTLAKKGKLALRFTGTNITIRLGVNPGWGVGQVYIDGKKPSTIPGVSLAKDSFTCDANAHGSWGNEYLDITLADGLSPSEHLLEVYCNNSTSGAGGFVVVTGCKVFAQANVTRDVSAWIAARTELAQGEAFKVTNLSGKTVCNVRLRFPRSMVSPLGAALSDVVLGNIAPNESASVTAVPDLTGAEDEGMKDAAIEMQASYQMDGETGSGVFVPKQSGLTYTGTWFSDSDFGELREIAGSKGASFALVVNADNFTLRVQRDYGWGNFLVMVSPIEAAGCTTTSASPTVAVPAAVLGKLAIGMYVMGTGVPALSTITALNTGAGTITLSANATASSTNRALTFEQKLATVTCHDANGGGFFSDVPITGLPAAQGNKVRLVADSTKPAVWSRLAWEGLDVFETVTETLHYRMACKHVPPFPLRDVRLEQGQVVWTPGAVGAVDLSQPYDNRRVGREEVAARFPTYIVIYQPGHQETIKQYDIAVIDPFGTTRKQVRELQELGIKVIVYVSFGEEDGTLKDKWDPNSPQVPWVGDGKGPGGYASYYMKGGYGFGEMSECKHDCQRVDGTKRCAMGNAKYNPNWSGRCSAACSKDWRDGYLAWTAGGACGGGYTSSNNWQRDASQACSNQACPKYAPSNTKCSQFEGADAWGQDFSMAANFPDENGVWSAYYVDAVSRGPNSWHARIRDYYLPLIFDLPTPRDEVRTVIKKVVDPLDLETGTVHGIELSHAPVDEEDPLLMIHLDTGHVYQQGLEWDADFKLGIVKLHPNEDSPPVQEGTQIRAVYSTKGLGADGVFMDTVDTVDIYPDEPYQQAAADLINDMKALYPSKSFCSNRGFSILDRIIKSCSYVMFESFLTDYNWETGEYGKISEGAAAWNDEITKQLFELRRNHVFDVLALNYCDNGSKGDELRAYIRQESLKRGWLSWSSEILLNKPLPNAGFTEAAGPIRSNAWRVYRGKRK